MDRHPIALVRHAVPARSIVLALALVPAACHAPSSPSERAARPNVVVLLADQWRAQATGYAGDPNVRTPRLDRLASASIDFVNAVSVCPVCTPFRAALMTGRYPLSTGMFLNDLYLPDDELCMGEIFADAGYATGYIGKWHLDGHGRDAFIPRERRQGFDEWKVLECTHQYEESYYYDGDDPVRRKWDGYDAYPQTRAAQEFVREHARGDRPFLLVVAYGVPHFPHETAPDELEELYPVDSIQLRPNVPEEMQERARKEARGYYAHCTALDGCIGDLVDTLEEVGVADDTIVVFTADHGEMLGSQGQAPKQKQRPWDESIRVPFLLRYPSLHGAQGRKVEAPLTTPEILPTLLALCRIRIPGSVEGEDLSRFVRGATLEEDRAALVMNVSPFGWKDGVEFRGVRTSRYTYVERLEGPWLLYDNERDPYQMANLVGASEYAELQARLARTLADELEETNDPFLPAEEHRRQWGYEVDGGGAIPYVFVGEEGVLPADFEVQSPRAN